MYCIYKDNKGSSTTSSKYPGVMQSKFYMDIYKIVWLTADAYK